ncbi:sortase [uncultured Ruminococcus sp.]|uniref:sortase domain-containing protein n=1 Tax=uncultured Ruminococcus sp. TaxID=165186 RepID=UPI0025E3892C|nr:sortase [uncultured Ruminococcus sp.]
MSEKITDGSSEAQRRAEKIKAIRRSIRSEAEVAPMTYENKSDSERSESMADRIARVKEKHTATAADILDELDKAIAREKADAERLAAKQAEAEADVKANASPDISDILPALETPAHEELQELAEEVAGDFTEVSGDITGYTEGFTETEAEAETYEAEVNNAYAQEAETESVTEEKDEETMVFTPIGHAAETKQTEELVRPLHRVNEDKAPEPIIRAAAETTSEETKKPSKKKKKKKKKTIKQRLLDLFPKKGDRLGERIRKIVFLGSVVAIVVCGYIVGDYYYDLWSSKRKTKNLMDIYEVYGDQEAPKEEPIDDRVRYLDMLPGARKLWEQNHDIVGVITIPNTPINNPVMQAEDNYKYLNKKFDLSDNIAGELFLDYRNHFDEVGEDGYLKCKNSDNLIIYGHNMYDDQMFGCLKYYNWREDYYSLHPVINLRSNYENYKYKIFAFFILDAEDESDTKFDCWNNIDFDGEEDFYNFVNEAKRRSIRLNKVDVQYGDQLLTLSTCNTTLADEDRGRIIIMARRVRDGEDPIAGTQDNVRNPNIKWPNLYYENHSDARYDPNAPFEPYGPAEAKKKQ